jgi:hypothetical protein
VGCVLRCSIEFHHHQMARAGRHQWLTIVSNNNDEGGRGNSVMFVGKK